MTNLIDEIVEIVEKEKIVGVVIGETGLGDYGSDAVPLYSEQPKGKVLDWETAKKYLNYEYDSGMGAFGCNAIYVWTDTKVLFVSQYDGATSICSIPRNPIDNGGINIPPFLFPSRQDIL